MLSDSEEEDTVVKIENVLDEIDEENCIAMGGIDDKTACTFIRGYVKRQALYTCRTCLNIDEVKAGICFPCAMKCHADHDVVELYTKRRFRCDCGNAKFAGISECLLWEEKDDENNLNQYSENFSNRYCTCQRPYPDPDYDGVEEMIQCGICENWFHLEHLNMNEDFEPPGNYNEMTCFMCIRKYFFLFMHAYNTERTFRQSCDSVACIKNDGMFESDYIPDLKRSKVTNCGDLTQSGDHSPCHLSVWASKIKHAFPMFRCSSLDSIDNIDCDLVPSVFWISDWRGLLCRCDDCKEIYMYFQVEFLLDPEDSVSFYMQLGKQRTKSINEEEKRTLDKALAELPHHVVVNFATGFARLKGALEEFFTKKRDENHVVTESEVRAFFEDFRKRSQS
ncbi:hypothetical protein MN116_003433 [Schistosoma mekongi]|uniref:UBR-type domain-containing protein n=1 Tax=Schistosoma mekongi TaxID=38744 RepID=A0AAE2D7J2_SCHME|nr:hypothetical protein MN116_003433 [Schistosoma mekongi]